MVQVEVSISSIDEKLIRKLEFFTPTIKKRMETIDCIKNLEIFAKKDLLMKAPEFFYM
jgi:DNA repair photolyase